MAETTLSMFFFFTPGSGLKILHGNPEGDGSVTKREVGRRAFYSREKKIERERFDCKMSTVVENADAPEVQEFQLIYDPSTGRHSFSQYSSFFSCLEMNILI